MPHLVVIQLMRVIKWQRSDSDGSCVNKNVCGNKGFYSIWTKPWHSCTHLIVLCKSFPVNTDMTGFSLFQTCLQSCVLNKSSLGMERANPSNAVTTFSQRQRRKDFQKPSKPYHVGIHWIALAEYSQMSTNMPVFQSCFSFFCIFLYWPN